MTLECTFSAATKTRLPFDEHSSDVSELAPVPVWRCGGGSCCGIILQVGGENVPPESPTSLAHAVEYPSEGCSVERGPCHCLGFAAVCTTLYFYNIRQWILSMCLS